MLLSLVMPTSEVEGDEGTKLLEDRDASDVVTPVEANPFASILLWQTVETSIGVASMAVTWVVVSTVRESPGKAE